MISATGRRLPACGERVPTPEQSLGSAWPEPMNEKFSMRWTRARSPEDVVAAMEAADVPASKIYTIADIVKDAQYQAREMIRDIRLADGSALKVPGVVPKLSATPGGFDAGGPALGADGKTPSGTGAIDHLSLTAFGWDDTIERLCQRGYEWRENVVPGTTLWQIFVYDPSGVQLELTYDGRAENRATPEIPPERLYRAGQSFYRPRMPAAAE